MERGGRGDKMRKEKEREKRRERDRDRMKRVWVDLCVVYAS